MPGSFANSLTAFSSSLDGYLSMFIISLNCLYLSLTYATGDELTHAFLLIKYVKTNAYFNFKSRGIFQI